MIEVIKKIDTTKILGNPIFIIAAIVFLYSPSMFNHLPIISKYDAFIKLLFVGVVFGCYLIRILNGKKIDGLFVLLNIYSAYQFVITVVNKGDIAGAIWLYWILSDALFLFIDMEMDDGDRMLQYICNVFLVMILINMYTVLMNPYRYSNISDMNEVYLFGNYNSFINYFFPFIIIIYYLIKKGKSNMKATFLVGVFIIYCTYYFARSLTSIIVLSILIIYLILFNTEYIQKVFNLNTYFFLILLLFFGFVISRFGENLFSDVLALFNKDITLSGRTEIWNNSVRKILENPVWGHGTYTSEVGEVAHSHNLILEILFRTGFVGGALYLILWKKIWDNIKNNEDFIIKGLLSIAFFTFWLRAQFETGNQLFIILIVSLIWKLSSTEKIKIKYSNI